MTLDEAFARLEVARTATPDEARRAYFRLLKTHRPESDPEGFRALREAYELARRVLVALPLRIAASADDVGPVRGGGMEARPSPGPEVDAAAPEAPREVQRLAGKLG